MWSPEQGRPAPLACRIEKIGPVGQGWQIIIISHRGEALEKGNFWEGECWMGNRDTNAYNAQQSAHNPPGALNRSPQVKHLSLLDDGDVKPLLVSSALGGPRAEQS